MNKAIISGNLGQDPTITYSTGENARAIARFSVACQRKFKNAEGKYDTDWISCVCFGSSAEFVEKYFHKGDRIELSGRIQTGSYTNKDGVKVYTTDIVAEEVGFGGSKSDSNNNASASAPNYNSVADGSDEELPFD